MDELMDLFIEETREYLEILDEGILLLEKNPKDMDTLNSVFRAAHTIKGSSAAMGYIKMQKVTHAMEDVLHSLREGKMSFSAELIRILLECHDFLESSLSSIMKSRNEGDFEIEALIKGLSLVLTDNNAIEAGSAKDNKENCISEIHKSYSIALERIKEGYNPYQIRIRLTEECQMKECTVFLIYHRLEEWMEFIKADPGVEEIKSGKVLLEDRNILIIGLSRLNREDILNELDPGMDIEAIDIELIDTMEKLEKLIDETTENDEKVSNIVDQIIGEPNAHVLAEKVGSYLPKVKGTVPGSLEGSCKETAGVEKSYVRIPTGKIDNMVDMIGELIIIQSLLEEEAGKYLPGVNSFMNNLLRMARIMKDVQNLSMSLRMVPLKPTFQKILRIGRDTATELEKNVDITIKGEETEIDRSVAEKIVDPLMHLVRNSIFHGIESIDERVRKGKKPKGTINLSAYSKRGNVYISIEDDGRGINTERVLKKALERNLAEQGREYTDEEIIDFIFLPGFSTLETVNNISGRGVGMDVVRTEIKKIGGKVEVINRPDEGCSFILKIPINLAVVNGTIIDVCGSSYIIPTIHIKQTFKSQESFWVSVAGKNSMVNINNKVIPIIPLEEYFGYRCKSSLDEGLVIVLELEQKLKAIHVRNVIGKREIVVKPLGEEFSDLGFISGASILGNGRVALILDVDTLFGISD